jgi:hypothetical protein
MRQRHALLAALLPATTVALAALLTGSPSGAQVPQIPSVAGTAPQLQTAAQRAAQVQTRVLVPNVPLVDPSVGAQRLQQLKAAKRRADMNSLRAMTSRAADGSVRHRISPTQTVVLLDQSTLNQTRSITPSLRPATKEALDRYKDYVQGQANAVPTPARISLKQRQTPVKDQGGRGTCVAFAIVGAIEAGYNANGQLVDLSEEDAFSTLKMQRSCDDGTFVELFQLSQLSGAGVSLESDWPYSKDRRDIGCPRASIPRPARAVQNAKWAPTQFWSSPRRNDLAQDTGEVANNPRHIEAWLATGHEVYIAVGVANNLGARGVIDVELDERGEPMGSWAGHAMLIVGYDKADGGTFEVKNSWGTAVGDGGYIKLSYDYLRTYAWNASILTELKDVAPLPSRAADVALPAIAGVVGVPGALPTVVASGPRPAVGTVASADAQPLVSSLTAQLRQHPATKQEAAHLNQCQLVDPARKEGTYTYERTIPLGRVNLEADLTNPNSSNTFQCRGGQACITYVPVNGAPPKAARDWVHASILGGGTPEAVRKLRTEAVDLWRRLIVACTP